MSTFVLKNVVLSYPHLIEANPQQLTADGKPIYTACLLIDKSDSKQIQDFNLAIKQEAQKAMQKTWQNIAPKNYSPLKDGDGVKENGNSYGEECKGRYILNVKAYEKPCMVDEFKKACYDSRKFYPGCRVHAQVSIYGYNVNGKKGITAKIINVMWAGDDKRLGGYQTPEEAFEGIPIATVNDINAFGLQDDLPF